MGQNTAIEWTHHTFNPWRGCTKISPGCTNCYADAMSARNPAVLGVWGPKGTRVVASEATWREPLKWNRKAKKAGERHRVFCASLADVFEDWDGPMRAANGNPLWWCHGSLSNSPLPSVGLMAGCRMATMDDVRRRLFDLIADTEHLDWLLLTKRPENVEPLLRRVEGWTLSNLWDEWRCYPDNLDNVWLGVSVENQKYADERIPLLLQTPAAVRFLSCEPLLGPVSLNVANPNHWLTGLDSEYPEDGVGPRINWCVIGGESGHGARPCHISWVKSIIEQCQAAGVPVFVKQLGTVSRMDVNFPAPNWKRSFSAAVVIENGRATIRLADRKGGDIDEFPDDLKIREFPKVTSTPEAR